MKSKKRLLKESCLYAVLDKKTAAKFVLCGIVKQLKSSGINIIQFRDKVETKESILKEAFCFSKILLKSKTIFIVNDYPDVARLINADGLHLGQADISIKLAREILKPDKIIGVSCHSLKEAVRAQKNGADYISIGPIFSTPTKPEYRAVGLDLIKKIKKKIHIPFFAIGGINQDNIDKVISAGARRIAVCRAILDSEDVYEKVKFFKKKLS
ncbi:MAG: thiamine phosphate synthase [Candidatus Omnitrophota bacterium]|nr:thiamine phosphate synthase [Candidatus Omnitrophota bacterium]